MEVEKLPSEKFITNDLYLHLAMYAYNALHYRTADIGELVESVTQKEDGRAEKIIDSDQRYYDDSSEARETCQKDVFKTWKRIQEAETAKGNGPCIKVCLR